MSIICSVDGLKVRHAIVTETCRLNRGAEGAIDEALARIKESYMKYVTAEANKDAEWNVVLTLNAK